MVTDWIVHTQRRYQIQHTHKSCKRQAEKKQRKDVYRKQVAKSRGKKSQTPPKKPQLTLHSCIDLVEQSLSGTESCRAALFFNG